MDPGAGGSPEEVLAAYRNRADVEYAEFNPIISICATPNDPSYGEQWSLAKIHAPEAWDTCHGGNEVVVAVIDTGVDYNHRDLQGNLWVNEAELNGVPGVDDDGNGYVDDIHGYNFAYNNSDPIDDHGHGTHVTGIVAAAGNNDLDVAGVCWNARIMAIKILGADGDGTAADAVPAIYYAVANGADIISGSWGGQESSDALKEAIAYANRQGVIVVAAAGNEGSDAPYYPAAYPEVLSVAATDSSDHRWYLSNYGDWVDIAAPGRDIAVAQHDAVQARRRRDIHRQEVGDLDGGPARVGGLCAAALRESLADVRGVAGDPDDHGRSHRRRDLLVERPAERVQGPACGDSARRGPCVWIASTTAGRPASASSWRTGTCRGAGRQVVLMETAGGDEETVTLTETPVSLGVFRGEILVRKAAVTPGDGILQAQDGQSIVARYLDDDDGLGHTGQWREAIAVADYKPPVCSGCPGRGARPDGDDQPSDQRARPRGGPLQQDGRRLLQPDQARNTGRRVAQHRFDRSESADDVLLRRRADRRGRQ